MRYVARLAKEGRRTLIEFPECPGCQTFAEPGQDVLAVAREALEGWLEAELVYGEAPPQPRASRVKVDRSHQPVRINPALAVRLQLRWARLKLNMSQAELAKKVGVSRQQISLLESPDANLTLSTLARVVDALGLDLSIELREPSAA
jgi:DNA-binding XRE family transcriptional regulator/predicted RNase H-like HicB family nuclease